MKKLVFLTAMLALLMFLLLDSLALGQEVPPGPAVKYKSTLEVTQPPGQSDAIQMVLDFAPGAWTPLHSHGGQVLVTILEGEITERRQGAEKTHKAGEGRIEQAGAILQAGNNTTAPARLATAFLLPKEAELTTVQTTAPVGLSQTGESDPHSLRVWLLLLAGSGLIVGGWFVRRKTSRSS